MPRLDELLDEASAWRARLACVGNGEITHGRDNLRAGALARALFLVHFFSSFTATPAGVWEGVKRNQPSKAQRTEGS